VYFVGYIGFGVDEDCDFVVVVLDVGMVDEYVVFGVGVFGVVVDWY